MSLCCEKCKADGYHLPLVCKYFFHDRERLLQYFCNYPNLIKIDQLMNTVNVDQLNNISVLCSNTCNEGAAVTDEKLFQVCCLYALGQEINSIQFMQRLCFVLLNIQRAPQLAAQHTFSILKTEALFKRKCLKIFRKVSKLSFFEIFVQVS